MNQQQIITKLKSCKISTLNDIAILCGSPILGPTKSKRIEGIISQYNLFQNQFLNNVGPTKKQSILSIDIGIKNFSYCKSYTSSNFNWPIEINKWDKLNLNEKYGINYVPVLNPSTIIDQKRYLNFITNSLIDDLKPNLSKIKIIEIQRTRSNNNSKTLPIIMQNSIFENLLLLKIYPEFCFLVTSFKMIHFWIYRFISKTSEKNLKKNNKIIRKEFIFSVFNKLFKIPGYTESKLDSKKLLEHLKLQKNEKIDDLIDSLLYNLLINCQLNNLYEFNNIINNNNENDNGDLIEFIELRNKFHIDLIKPLIEKYELELKI
ncbi:CCE1 [Candida pseudojiufengensis]|uniref:CCE1 n=1 Tax=Candida pseudojiufengensis TaxID=497109 RepID=UPI0022253B4D|nr:CCE1 [Candida pseudojiufengensis]KAI5966862.1 CCE1 [Candida pseudojiufengensis]